MRIDWNLQLFIGEQKQYAARLSIILVKLISVENIDNAAKFTTAVLLVNEHRSIT